MKRTKIFMRALTFAALTTILMACSNEELADEQPQPINNKVTISASIGEQSKTRMTVTETGGFGAETLELKWEVGDQFELYDDIFGSTRIATFGIVDESDISADGTIATFTSNDEFEEVVNGVAYACFFELESTGLLTAPTSQSANDATIFGGKGLPMMATGVNISAGSPATINFEHLTYVFKFTFRVPSNVGNPGEVELASTNEALRQSYNSFNGYNCDFTLTDYDFGSSVTSFDVYIPLFPADDGLGDLTVTLKDVSDGIIGEFTAPTSTTSPFVAGYMYTANLSFVQTSTFDAAVAGMTNEELKALDYATGSGDGSSPEEAILIGSAAQLLKLIAETQGYGGTEGKNNFADKYIKLITDIHVTVDTWAPLGTFDDPFWGNFDGNGHSITGKLASISSEYSGFFGFIDSNTSPIKIKNLTVAADVSGEGNVGGIIGMIQMPQNEVVIENCHFKGNMTGQYSVGGIAGNLYGDVTVKDCTSAGYIEAAMMVGGVIGSSVDGLVTACENYAKVMGTSDTYSCAGGIAGYCANDISNCVNHGEIDGYEYVGGVVGFCNNFGLTFSGNTNNGKVGNNTANYVGGIIGREDTNYFNYYIDNTNNSSEIYGASCVGGIWGVARLSDEGNTAINNINNSSLPDMGEVGVPNQL